MRQLTNLLEIATNKMLHDVVETAVREAVKLQVQANDECRRQEELRGAGKPFDFTSKHRLEEGVSACCHVLWRVFGGLPVDCINAVRKITKECKSLYPGNDSQDYVQLFVDALKAKEKAPCQRC